MGLMERRAVLAAEHPMSGICHCSTLSLLVKCVTFTSVLASVHQMSYKALLPHSVWCTLSKSGLVALIISGLLNNKELRIWKAENVYYSYPGVKTSSVSAIKSLMQWLGWSYTTPGSLPHYTAYLNRIVEDQRVGLGSDMTITQHHHLNVLFRYRK